MLERFLPAYVCLCLSVTVCRSVCWSVGLAICLSVCLLVSLLVGSSACLSIRLSVSCSARLSVSRSTGWSVSPRIKHTLNLPVWSLAQVPSSHGLHWAPGWQKVGCNAAGWRNRTGQWWPEAEGVIRRRRMTASNPPRQTSATETLRSRQSSYKDERRINATFTIPSYVLHVYKSSQCFWHIFNGAQIRRFKWF